MSPAINICVVTWTVFNKDKSLFQSSLNKLYRISPLKIV